MNRTEAVQEIRQNWRQILPAITARAKKNVNGEPSYVCPICGHGSHGDGITRNTASKDGNGLKCFGCGFSGDIIDLYQKANGADFKTAISFLSDYLGIQIDESPRQGNQGGRKTNIPTAAAQMATGARETPQNATGANLADYTEYYRQCRNLLKIDPRAAEYLQKRGISLETAERAGIGFDPQADPANAPGALGDEEKKHEAPRLIIPTGPAHYVARSVDPATPAEFAKLNPSRKKGAAEPGIFNAEALYSGNPVFITEGAFDALAIMENGADAIAINSTSNTEKVLAMMKQRKPGGVLILALDNDAAGIRAAERLESGLKNLEIPFLPADFYTNGGKDPNEAFIKNRASFAGSVTRAKAEAEALADEIRARRQQAEEERQKRTGAGMIDGFLSAVQTKQYEPLPTGIKDIDKAIGGGLIRQQLVLLGAAPGAGKTALAQWLFEGMAERGNTCIFLNLEMSREQMIARSLARRIPAYGDPMTTAEILQGYRWTDGQRRAILAAADAYKREIAPRIIYNPDGVTTNLDNIMDYLETEARRAESAEQAAPIIVIDYLQILTGGDREDGTDVIKRAVVALKSFAIRHNTIVFLITANSRRAYESGNPSMSDARDTSAIEYSADLQIGLAYTACLDRNGKKGMSADELMKPENQAERKYRTLVITKSRFAEPGTYVDLEFNGETMIFHMLEKPPAGYERTTATPPARWTGQRGRRDDGRI